MARDTNQYYIDLLKKHKLKITRPRLTVLQEFKQNKTALSQPDLERKLGEIVDRVTLYRCLATFEEIGIVHKILDLNGTAAYALCSDACTIDHHHDQHVHFICTACNNIYCLDDVKLPELNIPAGFQLEETDVQATGICDRCL